MIKSAVTISLVPEARGGPFVFWDDLAEGCGKAAELGFDGVEVFAPDAKSLESGELRRLLGDHGLKFAAAGTGAGWVKHKLTLTSLEPSVAGRAKDFVRSMMDAAAAQGAPAIIGSMQGRAAPNEARKDARARLVEVLHELGEYAAARRVPLLFEPLNRYETDLVNSVTDAYHVLSTSHVQNVLLLADLFHMNIEEHNLLIPFQLAGRRIGHVHFADSNRRPPGCGHTDFKPIAGVLREIGYDGYVSAEALPYPNPDGAATLTMNAFREHFRENGTAC